jgi:hypothetical protein
MREPCARPVCASFHPVLADQPAKCITQQTERRMQNRKAMFQHFSALDAQPFSRENAVES